MSWPPTDSPLSPQELGVLKARLSTDPHDGEARRALVAWYRRSGHVDQAGRYAIAIDGAATDDEIRAYSSMLRGLGANDERMHELSRLPDDPELVARASALLATPVPSRRERVAGAVASIAAVTWSVFGFAILVTLIATFAVALSGSDDVARVAATMGMTTLGIGAVACFLTSTSAALGRSPITAWVLFALGVGGVLLALPLRPLTG